MCESNDDEIVSKTRKEAHSQNLSILPSRETIGAKPCEAPYINEAPVEGPAEIQKTRPCAMLAMKTIQPRHSSALIQ